MRRTPPWIVRAAGALGLALVGSAGACSLALDTAGYGDGVRDAAFTADAEASDGSVDAGANRDGSRSVRCREDVHAFCADFDEGDLTQGWSSFSGGIGTFFLDSDASTTSPRSLGLDLIWSTDGPAVTLSSSFDTPTSAVTCEIDVRIRQIDDVSISLFQLALDELSRWESWIALDVSSFGSRTSFFEGFPDGGDRRGTLPGPTFVVGQWHRVRLEVSLNPPKTFRVSVDGTLAAQGSLVNAGPAPRWYLVLGPKEALGGPAAWRLSYDTVICDRSP